MNKRKQSLTLKLLAASCVMAVMTAVVVALLQTKGASSRQAPEKPLQAESGIGKAERPHSDLASASDSKGQPTAENLLFGGKSLKLANERFRYAKANLAGEAQLAQLLAIFEQFMQVADLTEAAKLLSLYEGEAAYEEASSQFAMHFAKRDLNGVLEWLATAAGRARNDEAAHLVAQKAEPNEISSWLRLHGSTLRNADRSVLTAASIVGAPDKSPAERLMELDGSQDVLRDDKDVFGRKLIAGIASDKESLASIDELMPTLQKLVPAPAIARGLGSVWASADTPGMAKWIEDNPSSETSVHLMPNLMVRWALTDSEAASRFLLQLPAGALREEGAIRLAQGVLATNPEDAIAWLGDVPDTNAKKASVLTEAKQRLAELKAAQR